MGVETLLPGRKETVSVVTAEDHRLFIEAVFTVTARE